MKKTIFKLLGTGLIAASVFGFVSCGDSTEYDAKSDTIYSLDAPRVTAKAYPGVNYISWEPVTSAKGYKIYRVLDGDSSKLRSVASDVTCYADIASDDHILSDGKVYKYIVEAVSGSDPASREVYAKNSQGSASVKAIVPTAGSKAISAEPASASGKDYIKKYYEKLVTKAAENVTLSIENGNFYAEYPATAGFKYEISASVKGMYDALGGDVPFYSPFENYKEDYKAELNVPVTGFSEHEIRLKVSSVSKLYEPVVVLLGSLSAESIGESESIKNVKAEYVAPTLTVSTFIESTAGIENTIKITSTKGNEKQTLALSYVKLAEDADGDAVEYITSDFTAIELANNNGYADSYINYIENAAAGTYLVKLTASEEGKKDSSVYKIVVVSDAAVGTSTLSVSSDGTKVTVREYIAKDSKLDSVGNYTYTLYKVVSTANKDYSGSVSVVTTNLGGVALAYPVGVTDHCEKEIPDTKSTELNVTTLYYVVKARVSDPSIFAKVSE